MSQEIDVKSIIIYGKVGKGKSLTGIICGIHDFFLNGCPRIYSNTPIFKNGIKISKDIDIDSIGKIRFSYTQGLIIVDEAGLNFNSRKGFSDANTKFTELQFLMRKLNCWVIWIGQRKMSIDVNARELADLIIRMEKISRPYRHPIFIAIIEKHIGNNIQIIGQFKIDILQYLGEKKITYNTLDKSKMIVKENESQET